MMEEGSKKSKRGKRKTSRKLKTPNNYKKYL